MSARKKLIEDQQMKIEKLKTLVRKLHRENRELKRKAGGRG
jgi:hypothetical protein